MSRKFLLYIIFILSFFILKSNDTPKDKIIIYYGIRAVPGSLYYDFQNMTEYKIVIENQEINLYSYIVGLDDYLISNEKMKKSEVEKIKKISRKMLKNVKLKRCRDIWNPMVGVNKIVPTTILREVYSEIEMNGEEYCMIGKTPLLEYLDKTYKFDIVWEAEIEE